MKLLVIFKQLYKLDQEIAKELQKKGCIFCGSKLDVANYMRKPRGIDEEIPEEMQIQFSLCCRDCRKRAKPISLRFLGPKVYIFLVVIKAMVEFNHQKSCNYQVLKDRYGVTHRTVNRWQNFWKKCVPVGDFFKRIAGILPLPIDTSGMPNYILKQFKKTNEAEGISYVKTVSFLSPLSSREYQVNLGR